MDSSKDLAHNITQKDEAKALEAAGRIVGDKNIEAFGLLCEKGAFLFDFVRENVKKRLKKAVNGENYKNLLSFFSVYSNDFSPAIAECLAKYADEDLTDEIYEFLESGTPPEKTNAARYFCHIPDTIAQEILTQEAFSDDEILAANSAEALGAMQDETSYNKALKLLQSKDDFEVLKGVKFLVSYGDKKAVKDILNCLETTAMPENTAGEILCLVSTREIIEKFGLYEGLMCLDHILAGLSEILPLENIFCYEIYETLEYLIDRNKNEKNSKIAQVLLRAREKFDTVANNDEYIFDESKEVKQEIREIFNLLNSNGAGFIEEQKNLLLKELHQDKKRIAAAVEIIREMHITDAITPLKEALNRTEDENLIVQIAETIKSLGAMDLVDRNELARKIKNVNLKALIESY